MIKKLSDKDKKDWESFVESKEKIYNKDLSEKTHPNKKILTKIIDLHGFSLENANKTINEFINRCFSENVKRVTVITGKGLRSKNQDNPYQSNHLGILKFSVPEYIKNNPELMDKILSIDFESINSPSKGSFNIILKKKNL